MDQGTPGRYIETSAERGERRSVSEMGTTAQFGRRVLVSNTAATMLSTLFPRNPARVKAAIAQIQADMEDPSKVRRIVGHDGVFVSRGHGLRVVFKQDGDAAVITSVAAEG